MKKFLVVVLSIFVVLGVVGAGGVFFLTRGMEAVNTVQINSVSLSQLPDGNYAGEYDAGRWSNEVMVKIENNNITSIDIIKDVRFEMPEIAQEIIDKVINKQNTDVDVISGATVTSKAYLKAIENALR